MASSQWAILLALVCATVHLGGTEDHDETLQPKASGSRVVEAVVDRIKSACIFSEDKLFIRRLAYVESHDGNDPRTYREGNNGGIWQVVSDQNEGWCLTSITWEAQWFYIPFPFLHRLMKRSSLRSAAQVPTMSCFPTSRKFSRSLPLTGLQSNGLISKSHCTQDLQHGCTWSWQRMAKMESQEI